MQDKDGNPVCKNDGEPFIHTDGTGFISEDLALKCPRNVSKGSVMSGDNVEVGDWRLDLLLVIHLFWDESIRVFAQNSYFWCTWLKKRLVYIILNSFCTKTLFTWMAMLVVSGNFKRLGVKRFFCHLILSMILFFNFNLVYHSV